MPKPKELEATADHVMIACFYGMGELMDASAPERPQLHKTLGGQKPGRARLLRKILDAEAPPTATEPKKTAPFTEIGILATIKANKASSGNREFALRSLARGR